MDDQKETDGRNWCFTKNNPKETDEQFNEYLKSLPCLRAFVFQRERGKKTRTEHFQGYIEFDRSMRFNKMQELLPGAHIEHRQGTKQQAVDYCKKEDTRIGSKTYEYGEIVEERQRTDLARIIDLLNNGADDAEIRREFPVQYLKMKNAIEGYRQQFLYEQQEKNIRILDVAYIYEQPSNYTARYVLEKYGLEKVYHVRFYDGRAWERYKGQEIILLDKYRSSFDFDYLLHYLNGLPMSLPCRYADRIACYTKVFIVADIPLEQQHADIKDADPKRWEQFSSCMRRIYNFDNKLYKYAFKQDDSSHSIYRMAQELAKHEQIFEKENREAHINAVYEKLHGIR